MLKTQSINVFPSILVSICNLRASAQESKTQSNKILIFHGGGEFTQLKNSTKLLQLSQRMSTLMVQIISKLKIKLIVLRTALSTVHDFMIVLSFTN